MYGWYVFHIFNFSVNFELKQNSISLLPIILLQQGFDFEVKIIIKEVMNMIIYTLLTEHKKLYKFCTNINKPKKVIHRLSTGYPQVIHRLVEMDQIIVFWFIINQITLRRYRQYGLGKWGIWKILAKKISLRELKLENTEINIIKNGDTNNYSFLLDRQHGNYNNAASQINYSARISGLLNAVFDKIPSKEQS